LNWSGDEVLKVIMIRQCIDVVGIVNVLPSPIQAQAVFDEVLGICSDGSLRILLVEHINDYVVFIAIPGGESKCDFKVWRYSLNLTPLVKLPIYDDLGEMFIKLKNVDSLTDEYLNTIIKFLRDRWSVEKIIQQYFDKLSDNLKNEIRKFLLTLKWIGLQEDVNYPPLKYLSSKMALTVYTLLEAGFSLSDVRRVVRF